MEMALLLIEGLASRVANLEAQVLRKRGKGG